jgi:hypothetical protein
LNAPKEVIEYSLQFLKDSNDVHKWLTENYIFDTEKQKNKYDVILTDKDRIKTSDMWTAFKLETRSNMDLVTFSKRLSGMGIHKKEIKDKSYRLYIKTREDE